MNATMTVSEDKDVTYSSLSKGKSDDVTIVGNDNINETISFDFLVSLKCSTINTQKLQEAVAKSVDVCNQQVTIEKCEDVSDNKGRLRIRGLVNTNSWELHSLSGKFSRLISERILSGTMQNVLELEERPRISRFYSRCSNQNISSINKIVTVPFNIRKSINDQNNYSHDNINKIENFNINDSDNHDNQKCPKDDENNNINTGNSNDSPCNDNDDNKVFNEKLVHCGLCIIL